MTDIDIDKLEALLAADAGIPDVPNADSKPHWMAVYACYDAAPALFAEIKRLRAIEAAARGLMVPHKVGVDDMQTAWLVCVLPSGDLIVVTIERLEALKAALAAKETP